MSAEGDWSVPLSVRPKVSEYGYDLERALASVVNLRAIVPSDAFTADTLGTERAGNGVLIREDGLVLTIGYLVTEASDVWLTTNEGRVVQGHVVAYDQVTGFGLVQALGRLDIPVLPLGQSGAVPTGERVVIGAAGGRQRSVAARVVAKQEFAGYWEYLLEEAMFVAPAHPHWGGAALIGPAGELLGIGSLQLQHETEGGRGVPLNMVVPIDLLPPILDDLLLFGRPRTPPRPWLGLYATEVDDTVVVMGLTADGPARRAGLRVGDVLLGVGGAEIKTLAGFFRELWSLGDAGVDVPLEIDREGDRFDLVVTSTDRSRYLKAPRLH